MVRYSPEERKLPGYAGEHAMIRFYKDATEFGGWTGDIPRVISIGQMVKHRDAYCGLSWFEKSTEGLDRMMIGPHNDDIETMPTALLSYDDLKAALRQNRVYFYTGTFPAPYTLGFVEAWITGIPVVSIGHEMRDRRLLPTNGPGWFEIESLLINGWNGFHANDVDTLHEYVSALLNDYALAKQIGEAGRAAAIPIFGKEAVKAQWRKLLLG